MSLTSAPTVPADPAASWKALAHLIAARPSIRVWDPSTNKFDATRNLTSRLPRLPAAALIYHRNRTHILVLDFDTKKHGQHAVDADFARALSWITDAGGVAVTDQSTSGGRHIIVPLAIGTSATLAEIMPLMRLLEARLPSLDKTPMTNPKTGCITVPGSPCREGGHRVLDGPLAAAIESFTTRSDPGLLPRLNVLLGALTPAHAAAPSSGPDAITGTGPNARLSPEYTRANDLPERITAYATTGQLPNDSTWRSHSEARQAVLAHAVLHGHSLATVTALMAPGRPWHTGLATAYTRYHHHAGTALTRDWQKALTWAAATAHLFRPACAQEQVHTGGTTKGPKPLRAWLANALAWLDTQYAGHRYKWVGAAVYQALAIHAVRHGEIVNGVPVVGAGGRSLSIATGLINETTVWEFLRDTRDEAGSPLVRTRSAQGRQPDYYALTQQHHAHVVAAEIVERTRVEDVHMAWKIIGHRHRRIYELIAHRGLTKPADIFGAAHTSSSTGYTTLAALATAGLVIRRRGEVTLGTVTLDDIANAHQLDEQRAERIARHQRERGIWHSWLTRREDERTLPVADTGTDEAITEPPDQHRDQYLTAVLATGPPTIDEEQHALELLAELVGGRVLTTAS